MIDRVVLAPALPPMMVWALAAVSLAVGCAVIFRGQAVGVLRLCAIISLFVLLLRPTVLSETRQSLPNTVLILKDISKSAALGHREEATEAAAADLARALERLENLEVTEITVPGSQSTNLFESLATGLSGVARGQLAGVIALTDGRIGDAGEFQPALPADIPFHHFQIAHEAEVDRRISIIRAPQFGIVNENAVMDFIVEDFGAEPARAGAAAAPEVVLLIDGEEVARQTVTTGQKFSITAPLRKQGATFLELRVSPLGNELTFENNVAIRTVSVIQDRLRVLLVSGEPHAGERVWRTLLKSDPAVDLIHFTILKPVNKQAVATNEELSLIPFPENELFIEKLSEFDVLIFDRYTSRGVLTDIHFDSIAHYIRSGGAVLVSSGPEFSSKGSLAQRIYLTDLLPVLPDTALLETPFRPEINRIGQRHPITRAFSEAEPWGRWMRLIGGTVRTGDVLMTGPESRPLLVVDRIDEGRVAMLMSDHIWLWARGFEGGGPHRALLRRLVHWLMKEPDLEEEALRLALGHRQENGEGLLTLTRQSLKDTVEDVLVTHPDGKETQVPLSARSPGLWQGALAIGEDGLYTAHGGEENATPLRAAIYVGENAGNELVAVTGTPEHLVDIVQNSGGGFFPLRRSSQNADITLPAIKYVGLRDRKAQEGAIARWAGLVDRKASETTARYARPLLPPLVWLGGIIAIIIGAWALESQLRRRTLP